MSVTIRRTGLPLDLALANVMTVDDWRAVGDMAKIRIVERTKRGVPPAGVSWPPYSEAYAKRKAAAVGAGPVNLTVSGEMLNGLQVTDITPTSVTIGWDIP